MVPFRRGRERIVEDVPVVVADVRVDHGGRVFHCCALYEVRSGRVVRGREHWVTANADKPPAWRERWTDRS